METQELARIRASQSRRLIGVVALLGLGGLMLYLALAAPPAELVWQLFLVLMGIGALWMSQLMWRATAHALILTETALCDSDGTVVATLDQIESVDRGMLALKPSNGFMMKLKTPGSRVWRPGLWWRFGRRVAVGGVTAASQTKPVADILSMKLAERSDR